MPIDRTDRESLPWREPEPPPDGHLTAFQLEHLSIPGYEDAAGNAHVAECSECRARLAEVSAQRQAFLRDLPVEDVLARGKEPTRVVVERTVGQHEVTF